MFPGRLSEAIPGAGIEAIIATENTVSDKRPKLQWDGAFQLDRQIRNAPARIEPMRSSDCAGWTSFDAAFTLSAAIRLGIIRR